MSLSVCISENAYNEAIVAQMIFGKQVTRFS